MLTSAAEVPSFDVTLFTNTRDDYDAVELYMTFTGLSIETGDEASSGAGTGWAA